MNNLEKALNELLKYDEFTNRLASVLSRASEIGRISYDEIERISSDSSEDVLLLGNEWRLLVPLRTVKSAAWEDRLLIFDKGELFEIPNIVRYLVEEAIKSGCWNPGQAIARLFKELGEPAWERMPELGEEMEKQANDFRITADQIKKACIESGLGDRIDTLIAELKAGGVISPKLGSIAEVARAGSPIYELNPSLFVIKTGKK